MTDLQLQFEEEPENCAAPGEIIKEQGGKRRGDFLRSLPRVPAPTAIDRSAWVSGGCYFLAFLIALKFQPTMADELKGLRIGFWVLGAGATFFFIATISI